jgi:hypothetical protein
MDNIALECAAIVAIGGGVSWIFWLFTPSKKAIALVSADIWKRYKEKESDALNYMHREVDRQINKVRGILTFDGLLLVVVFRLNFENADHLAQLLSVAALFYISVSIFISLCIFLVQWGRDMTPYKNFKGEFDFKAAVVGTRTKLINCSVGLSGFSLLFVAVEVIRLFAPSFH